MSNKIIELDVVESTQIYIKENLENWNLFDSCFAKIQTNGYGRTGNWNSQFENLYFSKLLAADKYNHLTAICSMHMLASKYAEDIEIKVPNDLYYRGKKLGGFIIENTDEYAILGIGININGAPEEFTSLSNITNNRYQVDQLAAELDELINMNLTMSTKMLEDYYKQNCKIIGTYVEYLELTSGDKFSGIVTDLDSDSITIDGLMFNQTAIKILNKDLSVNR
ncbi:biotin--[acetyl-CoA-carboxylase] ligase [Mollicutes bacterium LVI A0039]|nr:biotin--[acetyl-CoA-carboxylase] ligase [Mollicutes bacterium LVI A0039]